MYLAFMGPYGEITNYPWDVGGIAGQRRFLERVNGLSEHIVETETEETTRLLHKTIQKVRDDIDAYKFNTAISALMVFLNHVEKHGLTRDSYTLFLRTLAPFAPHLTEELWHEHGEVGSVHATPWPTVRTEFLAESTATVSVQINGKMRGTLTAPFDADEQTVLALCRNTPSLSDKIPAAISRIVYVKNKILSIIG